MTSRYRLRRIIRVQTRLGKESIDADLVSEFLGSKSNKAGSKPATRKTVVTANHSICPRLGVCQPIYPLGQVHLA